MQERFEGYEEQYNDIVNYSGLSTDEIKEICEEAKRYFEKNTFGYTMQNIVDIIQFTSEIIASNKYELETRNSTSAPKLITIPEAIEMAIKKVIPEVDEFIFEEGIQKPKL